MLYVVIVGHCHFLVQFLFDRQFVSNAVTGPVVLFIYMAAVQN